MNSEPLPTEQSPDAAVLPTRDQNRPSAKRIFSKVPQVGGFVSRFDLRLLLGAGPALLGVKRLNGIDAEAKRLISEMSENDGLIRYLNFRKNTLGREGGDSWKQLRAAANNLSKQYLLISPSDSNADQSLYPTFVFAEKFGELKNPGILLFWQQPKHGTFQLTRLDADEIAGALADRRHTDAASSVRIASNKTSATDELRAVPDRKTIGIEDIVSLIMEGHTLGEWRYSSSAGQVVAFEAKDSVTKENVSLYEFLADTYYDLDVLCRQEGPFPAGILEFDPSVRKNSDRLTGDLVPPMPSLIFHREILDALTKKCEAIWDDATFSLASTGLDTHSRVSRINAYVGSYYKRLCSAGYLEYEILTAIHKLRRNITIKDLTARTKILSRFASPKECLLHGGGVDAALATSTLVVYRREKTYWMFCAKRNSAVATHGGLFHVSPSGMFQPITGTAQRNLKFEWNLMHNMWREYLEELFSVDEVGSAAGAVAPDYFYQHPNLVFMRKLLKKKSVRFQPLHLVFDLLSHRPEICSLLLIDDESWYENQKDIYKARSLNLSHLKISEREFVSGTANAPRSEEIVTTMPIDDPSWAKIITPSQTVAPGAVALILGVKEAVSMLGIKMPKWLDAFAMRSSRA